MLKRPHYIAASLVVLLSLIILNLPDRATARMKLAMGSLFLPLLGLAGSAHQTMEKASGSLLSRSELLKQNATLERQNQELRLQLTQATQMARENANLRQQLGWKPKNPWQKQLANVVLHDPANWWHSLQIDRGSRDGIKVDMPVMTPDGLVGRVSAVGLTRSQVLLIGDPGCKVSAQVNEVKDSMGMITSSGPFDSSMLTLDYLPKSADLKPGQTVVTTGQGTIFPKGIPIGRILDTRLEDDGLVRTARVKPAANLSSLEEVWVITTSQ